VLEIGFRIPLETLELFELLAQHSDLRLERPLLVLQFGLDERLELRPGGWGGDSACTTGEPQATPATSTPARNRLGTAAGILVHLLLHAAARAVMSSWRSSLCPRIPVQR
jgi:hypothetical protein